MTSSVQDEGMADVETLTGTRVRLRAPRVDDAEAIFGAIASDPEVTRYLSWKPHPDVDETRRVITEFFNVGDERTWLIELRDTAQVVGLCGFRRPQPHTAELGYCLARPWWNRKIMSEVLPLLLEVLERDPGVYRVWAVCHVHNTPSAWLLQRGGLSLEGRLARYGIFPNISLEPEDVLLFAKALR
jgi:[ribosomal protein S5]-alanine N-acetyltransferase